MSNGYEQYENINKRRPSITREEYLERKKRRRRKEIIRVSLVWTCLLAAAALVIVLLVMGIKAIFGSDEGDETTMVNVLELDSSIEGSKNGEENAAGSEISAFPGTLNSGDDINMADNSGTTNGVNGENYSQSGPVVVNGVEIFSGYTINKPADIKYIGSENVQSEYALIVDGATGEAIASKEGFTRINPASMTKIMTVLVAADHITEADLDNKVTITQENTYYAYRKGLSAVGFSDNEVVTIRDLFMGTILPSGADAAIALAELCAGSEESFVEEMNQKARELGLKDTHFTNCVGSFNEDHYSTCADMAVILKAAIEKPICYEALYEHRYTTSSTAEHPDGLEISNWFLRRIEDKDTHGEVLCAKTGYVNQSGSCAASYSVDRNGHPYFVVTAKAHSAWRCIYDHVDIYVTYTGN
ncbi:MAG: serine hydrolase [Lachnospiraceae bacterium]|nr:serine hydrolase [Lachnospiraceae bacterium]